MMQSTKVKPMSNYLIRRAMCAIILHELDKLDAIDNKLVKLLEQNAWQSSGALAKALHISSATVRRRKRYLIQEGILRAVAIVDSGVAALPLTAIVALDLAHQDLNNATKALTGLSEIIWCALTTGQFDVIFLAQFPSMKELHEFLLVKLPAIEGVKNSETFVCINVEKGRHLLSID